MHRANNCFFFFRFVSFARRKGFKTLHDHRKAFRIRVCLGISGGCWVFAEAYVFFFAGRRGGVTVLQDVCGVLAFFRWLMVAGVGGRLSRREGLLQSIVELRIKKKKFSEFVEDICKTPRKFQKARPSLVWEFLATSQLCSIAPGWI